MNALLLAAEETAQSQPERLWLQYVVYAAIIVAGIAVLLLMKRASRLPSHAELKKRLSGLVNALEEAEKEESGAVGRMKTAAKLVTAVDRLSYTVYAMAQKERDGDLDSLSVLLEQARGELAALKTSSGERTRLTAAREKVTAGIALLDRVIERDAAIAKKRKNR